MPTRPPALMRGPSAKPRSRQEGAFTSRAASASADQAEVLAARHHLQPLGDEGAVERLQPGDVGDRAERDQVEQVDDRRLAGAVGEPAAPAKLAHGCDAQQEGHADGGEMAVGGAVLAFVEAVGIDDRIGRGQLGGALVVVADDDVEAGLGRRLQRREGLGAAIDGDDQIGARSLERDQRIAGRAVALHQPVGDVGAGIETEPAQQQDQQGGAGRAVDVIVAEDGDRFLAFDGVGEPRCGLVHVLEDGRIGQEIADRRLAVAGEVGGLDAAGEQQLVDQRHAQIVAARAAPAPGLAAQRTVRHCRRRSCEA